MKTELALFVMEYPDGTVAVQAYKENTTAEELYANCHTAEKTTEKLRMTLINVNYGPVEGDTQNLPVKVCAQAKIINETLPKKK